MRSTKADKEKSKQLIDSNSKGKENLAKLHTKSTDQDHRVRSEARYAEMVQEGTKVRLRAVFPNKQAFVLRNVNPYLVRLLHEALKQHREKKDNALNWQKIYVRTGRVCFLNGRP
ncbi:MAG: hypothetical protein SGARI_000381 [Bacillariaceae sp.]